MHAGGLAADEQLFGDLAVGAPLDQQPQHLKLTGGEAGQGPLGRQRHAEIEAALAGQRLQRALQRLGAKPHGRLMRRTGGSGRLFPTGALRLLLGKRSIHEWRVMALGLRREYRTRGILPLFAWEAFRRGRQAGEQGAEASWILEDNEPMNRAMAAMGTRIHRRWRVYDRGIRPAVPATARTG